MSGYLWPTEASAQSTPMLRQSSPSYQHGVRSAPSCPDLSTFAPLPIAPTPALSDSAWQSLESLAFSANSAHTNWTDGSSFSESPSPYSTSGFALEASYRPRRRPAPLQVLTPASFGSYDVGMPAWQSSSEDDSDMFSAFTSPFASPRSSYTTPLNSACVLDSPAPFASFASSAMAPHGFMPSVLAKTPEVAPRTMAFPAFPAPFEVWRATTGPTRTRRHSYRVEGPASAHQRSMSFDLATSSSSMSKIDQAFNSVSIDPLPSPIPTQAGRRRTVESSVQCTDCRADFAWITIRGTSDELAGLEFRASYRCRSCAGIEPILRSGAELANVRRQQSTVSAATASEPTIPICETCCRDVGTGSICISGSPGSRLDEIVYSFEFLCSACETAYKRCSDCGGGASGKWRCAELFAAGRKTCSLDHTRSAHTQEMQITIGRAVDLASTVYAHSTIARCRDLLWNSIAAKFAIPEILTAADEHLSSFSEVKAWADTTWQSLERTLVEDIGPSHHIRRYIALCWTRPRARKASKVTMDDSVVEMDVGSAISVTPWDRPGRELTGWAMFAWDRQNGTIFIPVAIPWSTAEAFDANQVILTEVLRRVNEDRIEEIVSRVADGEDADELDKSLPIIKHVYTRTYHDVKHRTVSNMIKKRGFLSLDEYLAANKDALAELFEPQSPGWTTLVKRVDGTPRSVKKKRMLPPVRKQ